MAQTFTIKSGINSIPHDFLESLSIKAIRRNAKTMLSIADDAIAVVNGVKIDPMQETSVVVKPGDTVEFVKELGTKSSDFNSMVVLGRLTKDPKSVAKSDGSGSFTVFDVASNPIMDNKEDKAHVMYINCVLYDPKQCTFVEKYMKKGTAVAVEGLFFTEKWTNNNGLEMTTLKIKVSRVSFAGSGTPQNKDQNSKNQGSENTNKDASTDIQPGSDGIPYGSEDDDNCPF